MKTVNKFFTFTILLLTFSIDIKSVTNEETLRLGADRLMDEYFYLVEGKNIGVVTNHTGLLSNQVHLVDTLHSTKKVNIVALFGPEHGIRGAAPAGQIIKDEKDNKTGIQIFSLYGKNKKPTKEMLNGIDILVFDIQDVGARFYTYISTMFYIIQSAAENNLKVIILDRPNPINGINVDGPMLVDSLKSFVGIAPLPIMHGMTVGELANYFNRKEILNLDTTADITIVELTGWNRKEYLDKYQSLWVRPSPNLRSLSSTILYPGTCLIEGTNVSEGRGTFTPFQIIGAPYIKADTLSKFINELQIPGIKIEAYKYTPVEIHGLASNPKYMEMEVHGLRFNITDRKIFEPVKLGIYLIYSIIKLFPDKFEFKEKSFDLLSGDSKVRKDLLSGKKPEQIFKSWEKELTKFKEEREKYLLYK